MITELGLAFLIFHLPADEEPAQLVALRGLDPVALCQGKESLGLEEHTASDGAYSYRFASEENRKLFAANPERFGIQWGGACGRMGPLSGAGNPERFLVHEGRIYIFASDACRDTFRKAPEKFVGWNDPVPATTPEAAAKGKELLAQAVKAHGGAEKIDAMHTLEAQREWKESSGGKEWDRGEGYFFSFPDHIRSESFWGKEYRYADVVSPNGAFRVSNRKIEPMHAAAQRALRRAFFVQPLWMLKMRGEKGFLATAGASLREGESTIEQIQVAFDGFSATLGLDSETGRIVRVAYRGRGPKLSWAEIVERHSDFREVGGVLLAHKIETSFDGVASAGGAKQWTIQANLPLRPEDFSPPK